MTRLIFAGTPAFAATIMAGLVDAGFEIPLVLTQPDRPAGRGMRTLASEVKQRATQRELTVYQPISLKSDQALARLQDARADAMVVAAYGLILPPTALRLFPCINVHASLLPRWRGAAPIQRAILAGDAKTGISIMRMEAGLDTGPVYERAEMPIDVHDTALTLHDKLAELGARTLVECLPRILDGSSLAVPQPEIGITYAAKIVKNEAALNWNLAAPILERQVRAFHGFPVAHATFRGELLRVWQARNEASTYDRPGEVVEVSEQGVVVACGSGSLRLLELQRAGARRLNAGAFIRGANWRPGEMFSSQY